MNSPRPRRRTLALIALLMGVAATASPAFAPGGRPTDTTDPPPPQNQGDPFVCDLNDGRIDVELLRDGTVRYEMDVMYDAFNVYRGEIGVLAASGIYTQDLASVTGARRWCGVTSGILTDTETPPPGGIFFYLGTGSDPDGESLPGQDSQQHGRPHHHPCRPCATNADCPSSRFCAKAPGNCGGHGVCLKPPSGCPDVWDPVCGCDGVTYGNACHAAGAGVNVLHAGACAAACTTNAECASGEYCEKAPGNCDGAGRCVARPELCPQDIDPVCGCDGVTYNNACEAASAGVNVQHPGACAAVCTMNAECAAAEYCKTSGCGGQGECQPRPQFCPDVWLPVCGCDRVTYGNACEAAAAGVSVKYNGECRMECLTNSECGTAEYCAKDPGACGAAGLCTARPEGCTITLWDPVCGCDGVTYGNACEAAAAGVNVSHAGECAAACTTNAECAAGEYCQTAGCGGQGQCQPRPQACPLVWMPVCGCDGVTYGNSCEAAAAGVNVLHAGECGSCTTNADCGFTQFCLKQDLDCNGTGTCTDRPTICPDVQSDICGCDGRIHMNSCTAHRAGTNVSDWSRCTPPP